MMASLYGKNLSAAEFSRRIGHWRQLAGVELGAYADGPESGVRYLDFKSGSGLAFRVLIDRGMDIGELHLGGIPLGWRSPTGFRNPALSYPSDDEFSGILRGFDGFLVTCGLDHVRKPDRRPTPHFEPRRNHVQYPMHGRIGLTPAHLSGYGADWEEGVLWCEGEMRQAALYAENLVLRRRISMHLGSNVFEISDRISNEGYQPVPHMILYHFNLGFPLLDEHSQLLVSSSFAETGNGTTKLGSVVEQSGPSGPATPDEIVDLQRMAEGTGPDCALVNERLGDGIALALEAEGKNLSHMQIWRNLSDGMYVLGLEPAAQPFAPREKLEAENAIETLEPGEEIRNSLRITVASGKEQLDELRTEVN